MSRKVQVLIVLLLLVGLAATAFCVDTARDADKISEKLIRFHVLANSDSKEDQALKIKVKDVLFEEISSRLDGVTDKEQAREILNNSLDDLCALGEQVVMENGYNYPVTAAFEKCGIDEREYGSFALPAGEYEALRVLIGEGGGKTGGAYSSPLFLCGLRVRFRADIG